MQSGPVASQPFHVADSILKLLKAQLDETSLPCYSVGIWHSFCLRSLTSHAVPRCLKMFPSTEQQVWNERAASANAAVEDHNPLHAASLTDPYTGNNTSDLQLLLQATVQYNDVALALTDHPPADDLQRQRPYEPSTPAQLAPGDRTHFELELLHAAKATREEPTRIDGRRVPESQHHTSVAKSVSLPRSASIPASAKEGAAATPKFNAANRPRRNAPQPPIQKEPEQAPVTQSFTRK